MIEIMRLIVALVEQPDVYARKRIAVGLIRRVCQLAPADLKEQPPPPIDGDGPLRMTLADDEPKPRAAQPERAAEPVQATAATSASDPFGAALAASGGAVAPAAVAEPAAAAQGDGDPSALDRNPFE